MLAQRYLFLAGLLFFAMATLAFGATTPAPRISAAPMSVNLGKVKVKGTSAPAVVTVRNTGTLELVLDKLRIEGINAGEFRETDACKTIPPGGTCPVEVSFSPALPYGKKSAVLVIPSNDLRKPALNVKLKGDAPAPGITVAPRSLNFGKMPAGSEPVTKTVNIGNSKTSDLEIGALSFSGANAADFDAEVDCASVPKGTNCVITVAFAAQGPVGKKSAILNVASNDPKKPAVSVKLAGEVLAAQGMAGSWRNHMLAAGDAPEKFGWLHNSMTYNAAGDLIANSEITDSLKGTYSWTYSYADLALDAAGIIKPQSDTLLLSQGVEIRGVMNSGENLSVLTGSYSPADAAGVGNDNLIVSIKRTGATFATTDMAGTWQYHALSVGDGAGTNLWAYGTFTVDAGGVLSYASMTRSTGDASLPAAETLVMSADGTVTSASRPSLHGVMSSDKKVIVYTVTDEEGGPYTLAVAVKAGAAFTQADLAGTWKWHALGAGDAANFWFYGNATIDAAGAVTFSSGKLSDGTSPVPAASGATALSSDGILTQVADASFHGVMTPGKDVIFMTRDANLAGSGTPSFWVGMKR